MVLGLAALGFKKAVKKLAPKAKKAGRGTAAAKSLSKMDSQNKSGTSLAADLRRDIKMFKDDADKLVKESDKRLLKQGAATTGAIGAGSAASSKRRNQRKK